MKRREPDWKRLGEIANRAGDLKTAGVLDYATWRALLEEAEIACNGDTQHTDILAKYAKREWIDRLSDDDKSERVG